MAIGSAFKLYVLGTLASQAGKGTISWEEKLAIQDKLKSLPSGEYQDQPDGTEHTIREFAEKMISISDNTAADHLIERIGRDTVEGMLAPMGHSDPAATEPFLKTREMFALKLSAPDALTQRYIAADISTRRKLLTEQIGELPILLADASSWTSPRHIDTIEWFASSTELANAMLYLHKAANQPGFEPIADVLSINPGLPFDTAMWPYVGFKGGSEPGVLSLTWLLRRKDDRWFVASCALNDKAKILDENAAIGTFAGAADLLAAYS